MSVPELLVKLVGQWSGVNILHTPWMPENPVRETASVAAVDLTARGRFLKIEYDWVFESEKQEGLMLIGHENGADSVKSFWIDSWHLSDKFMVSEGRQGENGEISLKGYYSVPDHPDWGWITTIEPEADDSLKIVMYNVTPEGEESLAVEMVFRRQP